MQRNVLFQGEINDFFYFYFIFMVRGDWSDWYAYNYYLSTYKQNQCLFHHCGLSLLPYIKLNTRKKRESESIAMHRRREIYRVNSMF